MGTPTKERPRSFTTTREQKATDEEIFDAAEIDSKKVNRLTLTKIVTAIVLMGEMLAGDKLYKYEREVAERIVWSLVLGDGETLTMQFARQGGKSFTVAQVVPACAIMLPLFAQYLYEAKIKSPLEKFRKGFWCGVYGPDYERAGIVGNRINSNISTQRARTILTDPDVGMIFPVRLTTFTGVLPRNSHINIKSANRSVSIEGDTFHLVVTDETQEISDYVLKK